MKTAADLPGTAKVLKHFKPGQHHHKASRCGQSTKWNDFLAEFKGLEIEQRSSLPGPDTALLDASSSMQIQTVEPGLIFSDTNCNDCSVCIL